MSEGYWERLAAVFAEALAVAPPLRAALVGRLCAGQARLRADVLSLLDAAAGAGDFLETPPMPPAQTVPACAEGERFGAWRVLRAIGAGGMGEVFEVERVEGGYRQRGAIKLSRTRTPEALQRFNAERQILATLAHPGIARLLDGGTTADGRPFAVMEFVDGQRLDLYCSAAGCPIEARIGLLLQVCEAVAHAHRHLVVHRDLKPANILVDREGRVRLLDFGIAKLMQLSDEAIGGATLTGPWPLTPDYCAPEQAAGEAITTATDVYALGVLAFELLSGQRLRQPGRAPLLALRDLLDTPAPSASSVAARAGDVRAARRLRGDLDAIVARCLRREPEHRYRTVDALRQDLQRHLAGAPVAARAGRGLYRLGRFLRRHRWMAALTAGLLAALITGLAGTLWQARVAERQAQRATAVQRFLVDIFRANASAQDDPVGARNVTARSLLDRGAQRIDGALNDSAEVKLALLDVLAGLYDDLALPDEETRLRAQAAAIVRGLHGERSAAFVDAQIALATAMYGSATPIAEREAVLAQAQAILDRRGDQRSERRARLLRAQAEHWQTRDLPRALAHARASVDLYTALPDSAALADAWYLRGVIEHYAGQDQASLDSLAQALAATERHGGERDPRLIVLHYQRAQTQAAAGDYAQAEYSARRAVALALAINGEDHVDAARTRTQLASVLFEVGHWREALTLLDAARELILRIRGPGDAFHTPAVMFASGKMHAQAGHLDRGIGDLESVLAGLRERQDTSLFAAVAREETAAALIDAARFEAAATLLEEAWQLRRAVGQDDTTAAYNGQRGLRIRLALDTGRLADAQAALAAYRVEPAADGSASASQLGHGLLQARVLLAQGAPGAAAARAAEVLDAIAAAGAPPARERQRAAALLLRGGAECAEGGAGAVERLREALLAQQRVYAPDSPRVIESEWVLAACEAKFAGPARSREFAAHMARLLADPQAPVRRCEAWLGMLHVAAPAGVPALRSGRR